MDSKDELFEQRKADLMAKSKVSNVADDLADQKDPWLAAKEGKEEVKEEVQEEAKEEAKEEVKEEAKEEVKE
jgi:calreticulin